MIASQITTAINHMAKHKGHSLINIISLAIGLTACLFILLFIRHELSYDAHLPDHDRIYRIDGTYRFPGREEVPVGTFFGGAGPALVEDFAAIDASTRIEDRIGSIIRDTDLFSQQLLYVDDNFVSFFGFEMLEGSPETALNQRLAVVLTEDAAQKYLGEGPWLGKTMTVTDVYEREVTVTGILKNMPDNSNFKIDVLMPFDPTVFPESGQNITKTWGFLPVFTYIKVNDPVAVEGIQKQLPDFIDRHVGPDVEKVLGQTGSETWPGKIRPLSALHIESIAQYDLKPHGSWTNIYGLAAIAFVILSIAAINYINFATARASLRAKEVGVRKVMGATRGHLFMQFELEAVVFAFLALTLSFLFVWLALPSFNQITNREILSDQVWTATNMLIMIVITLSVGVKSGLYPAAYLARLRPSAIISANKSAPAGGRFLRNSLVFLQFIASAALILGSALVFLQTDHAQHMNFGYDRNDKIAVRGMENTDVTPNKEAFKNRIMALDDVTDVSFSSFAPGDRDVSAMRFNLPDSTNPVMVFYRSIDWDFMDLYKVQPIAGRLFDKAHPMDEVRITRQGKAYDEGTSPQSEVHIIINEASLGLLGFNSAQEAVDATLDVNGYGEAVVRIIGVIPNVHFKTPQRPMIAEAYLYNDREMTSLNIATKAGTMAKVGKEIDQIWKQMFPRAPLQRVEIEAYIAGQFLDFEAQGRIILTFALIAVIIACIGLYGMANFIALQRRMEMGLRKIMGASSTHILRLMLSSVTKLIILANLIAWPLVWYFIGNWLQNFHYQIEMMAYFPLLAAATILVTLIIAWVTSLQHAWSIAHQNMVNTIHYE